MRPLAETVALDDDRQASYEVIGSGSAVLYFQGGPGFSANLLRDDAELLADRFAVYLIDPPGSGGSTRPDDPSEYDHLGHARFYDRVRQALGLGRVTVMGISFGSIVALTYAALYPEVTERCIAISARVVGIEQEGEAAADEMQRMLARHAQAPWYPEARAAWDGWTERVLAVTEASEVDEMMAAILPLYAADPERPRFRRLTDAWSEESRTDLAAVKVWESGLWQQIDIRPLLAKIRAPTLLITGEVDMICGPAQSAIIAQALRGAHQVSIPDCGHFVGAEAPEAFREAVIAFAG